MEKARLLVADAMAKHLLDSMVSELRGKITILETERITLRQDFTAVIAIEREKNRLQSANEQDFKAQIINSQSETSYFKKKERKARRERNVAIVIGAALLAFAAIK